MNRLSLNAIWLSISLTAALPFLAAAANSCRAVFTPIGVEGPSFDQPENAEVAWAIPQLDPFILPVDGGLVLKRLTKAEIELLAKDADLALSFAKPDRADDFGQTRDNAYYLKKA